MGTRKEPVTECNVVPVVIDSAPKRWSSLVSLPTRSSPPTRSRRRAGRKPRTTYRSTKSKVKTPGRNEPAKLGTTSRDPVAKMIVRASIQRRFPASKTTNCPSSTDTGRGSGGRASKSSTDRPSARARAAASFPDFPLPTTTTSQLNGSPAATAPILRDRAFSSPAPSPRLIDNPEARGTRHDGMSTRPSTSRLQSRQLPLPQKRYGSSSSPGISTFFPEPINSAAPMKPSSTIGTRLPSR